MTDILIRLSTFLAIFGTLVLLEHVIPRQYAPRPQKGERWLSHAVFGGVGYVVGRFTLPLGLIGAAVWAEQAGWGVFHQVEWPTAAEALATLVLLDFVVWAQHVAMHQISWLWPFHRVHHSDHDLDVTSTFRFHPGEHLLSVCVKGIAIVLLGPQPQIVLVFEALLVGSAMFNHAHIRLPVWLDKALSFAIVTPDMHRLHHDAESGKDRQNYGFFLNIWDKIFAVHRRLPADTTDRTSVGSTGFERCNQLVPLLLQPFVSAHRKK